jgi:hypothetical protein
VGADDRADLVGGQVDVAALAPRSHLEPAHRVILSQTPDRGRIVGTGALGELPGAWSGSSPPEEVALAEIQ